MFTSTRARRYLFFTFSYLMLFGLGYLIVVGIPSHPLSVSQMRTMVEKDIPINSSSAQVKSWLRAHKIRQWDYEPIKHPEGHLWDGFETSDPKKLGGSIYAVIEDVRRSPFVKWRMRICFLFDKKQKLKEVVIFETVKQ